MQKRTQKEEKALDRKVPKEGKLKAKKEAAGRLKSKLKAGKLKAN